MVRYLRMKARLRSWNLTDWDICVMWFLKDKLKSYITPRLRILEGLILLLPIRISMVSDLTFDNICGEPIFFFSRNNSDLESLSLSPLLSIHDVISSIHNSSCLMAVET